MGSIICAKRVSRYMEEKYYKRLGEEILSYVTIKEFLLDLKKEFRNKDDETIKIIELKKIKQKRKTIEEFVQEFRKAAKKSGYEEKLLVEEFKK